MTAPHYDKKDDCSAHLIALGSMANKQFMQGGLFRPEVTLKNPLAPGQSLYAEFEGPQEKPAEERITLKSAETMPLPGGNQYLIDGRVPKDAPLGFYAATKLEARRNIGGPQTQAMEIPSGWGFTVTPYVAPEPPPPPKIVSTD